MRNRTSLVALAAAGAFSSMMISDMAMAGAARDAKHVKRTGHLDSGASALTFASDGLDTTGSGSGAIDRHHAATDLDKMAMTSIAGVGDDLGGDTADGHGHITPS